MKRWGFGCARCCAGVAACCQQRNCYSVLQRNRCRGSGKRARASSCRTTPTLLPPLTVARSTVTLLRAWGGYGGAARGERGETHSSQHCNIGGQTARRTKGILIFRY